MRRARVPPRSCHVVAVRWLWTCVVMVEPPAPSVVVVESFQEVSGRTPPVGSRGKKLRKRGSRLPRLAAVAVSDGMGFLKSPVGLSRPVTRYPLALARLIWGGNWLP